MPANAPDFDPRDAAIRHSAAAEGRAYAGAPLAEVASELALTIACGLVYVGDQVKRVGEVGRGLYTAEEVQDIAMQAGGAVSAVFLGEQPDKVMPAEECRDAVLRVLDDFKVRGDA